MSADRRGRMEMSDKQMESGYWDREWWRSEYAKESAKESDRSASPYR